MAELRPHIAHIRELGGELIIIGNGSPFFARGFLADQELPADLPLVVDEKLVTYRAAGLARGVFKVLDVRALGHFFGSLARGHRQGRMQGDATQQGGVMVVGADGEIAYSHASRYVGDHDPVDQVMAAFEACRSSAAH